MNTVVSEFTDFWKNFERYFGRRGLVEKCRIFLDCCGEYRRSMRPCEKYGLLRFDRLSRGERAKYGGSSFPPASPWSKSG